MLGIKQTSEIEAGKAEKLKTGRHQEDCQWQSGLRRINSKEGEKERNTK